MIDRGHLWVVGFDDMTQAGVFQDEIAKLARIGCDLTVLDTAVAVRYPDGTLTLNGDPFYPATPCRGTLAHLLAALSLGAPPMTGGAVDYLLGTVGADPEVGISHRFVQEVQCLIKPATSALFVLDEVGNVEPVLRGIRGLGGTVLKTNVDVERARQIQAVLSDRVDSAPCNGADAQSPENSQVRTHRP